MNLDNIEFPANTVLDYTKKQYWGIYNYKVVIEVDRLRLQKAVPVARFGYWKHQYSNNLILLDELNEEIRSKFSEDVENIVTRREGIKLSFFTNNEQHVVDLVEKYKDRVIEIVRPLNSAHVNIMSNHAKVTVRKSLFLDSYRFKIYLKVNSELRETRYKVIYDYIKDLNYIDSFELNEPLYKFVNTSISPHKLGWTIAVYAKNVDDLMMFQLKFNDYINRIEEAVLLSDLKDS